MQASARLSSSAASRRVIADVSGVITRSCYRTCRGKAHAAALSGQGPPKGQKRMSKNERRVQMKEFIEIYKASNDGKFPTSAMVRQHVGGSHYTVREVLQEVIYNHAKLPLDTSQAAQPRETDESAEGSRPEEDNGSNSFSPKSFNGEQDIDDALLSQKDSATGTINIEKSGTWQSLELKTPPDSSHCNGETKTFKQVSYNEDILQVSYNEDILKNGSDSTVSGQAEIQGMKTEASISLGKVTNSDTGSHQVKTEANKLHMNNTENFQNASEPTVSSDREQDVDDFSQIDSATSTTGTWRSLTPDSSHYTEETEAGKLVSYTADISKNANDTTVSGQTETDRMKTEASMSLGLMTKSEPGNNHGETEASELHLNNIGKFQNASEPTVSSYQTKSDKVIKANAVDREDKREVEHQGSTKTSLLGSLKSFASGIMNLWKKL